VPLPHNRRLFSPQVGLQAAGRTQPGCIKSICCSVRGEEIDDEEGGGGGGGAATLPSKRALPFLHQYPSCAFCDLTSVHSPLRLASGSGDGSHTDWRAGRRFLAAREALMHLQPGDMDFKYVVIRCGRLRHRGPRHAPRPWRVL